MKAITKKNLTEEQINTTFKVLESLLEMDFESFNKGFKDNLSEFYRYFINLGILKARGNEKAIEIYNKYKQGHWINSTKIKQEENEKHKIAEITNNKNRFLGNVKEALNDEAKTIQIIRQYENELGSAIVIGCCYYNYNTDMRKFGGTTIIYEYHTFRLFKEIKEKYKVFTP